MTSITIVFVHGYSVTNLNTYGGLPIRLREEGKKTGIDIQVEDLFLGRYISFHDEVRLNDVSRAFQTAVNEQLFDLLKSGKRFVCITHSTGGPVVRNWWSKYYKNNSVTCPMSHLVMLAPANNGSALAQLGKEKLSRLVSWLEKVEPGQGILDWLELGSNAAFELNKEWIYTDAKQIGPTGFFPFVLIGQSIDRKLYDHLNSYTGELGSDGVVRTAAANLNSRYILLEQPVPTKNATGQYAADSFKITANQSAAPTPLRIVSGKSHSGQDMGIMNSVKADVSDTESSETINAIFNCINVTNTDQYNSLIGQFATETAQVQKNELVETEKEMFFVDRDFIHDRFSQVIFRVKDTEGYPVTDYDLILTAGIHNDPNHLPEGFLADRQRNHLNTEIITYFFNYDIMKGSPEIKNSKEKTIRPEIIGTDMLGIQIHPRPDNGFVCYLPCSITATEDLLEKALIPNGTTLIDIVLQRVVYKETFRLAPVVNNTMPTDQGGDFKGTAASGDIL